MMQACCAGTDADADTDAGDGAGGCWLEQAANPNTAIPLVHFLCMANSLPNPVAGSRHDPGAM
jgi:hypothetical protein